MVKVPFSTMACCSVRRVLSTVREVKILSLWFRFWAVQKRTTRMGKEEKHEKKWPCPFWRLTDS